ncbi:MAG TPA: hypothetical protein VMT88_04920 [Actinomycetes bacterium]|nr:hypothetical protein [Actinomycetes bacterium]
MRSSTRFVLCAVVVPLLVVMCFATPASARPVSNPNSVTLTAQCDGGRTYTFLVSPASGSAVLDTQSTAVQVTFALAVSDPLNEFGGSFSVPFNVGIPQGKLISCSGTVIGTQQVTYTATVLLAPVSG